MQIHSDERGFFQELFHLNADDFPIAQLSWFSIEPDRWRGNHFHFKTKERFIVLEGTADLYVSMGSWRKYILNQGDTMAVYPLMSHLFYSKDGAKVLVASSRHFNANETDTYPSKSDLDTIFSAKETI